MIHSHARCYIPSIGTVVSNVLALIYVRHYGTEEGSVWALFCIRLWRYFAFDYVAVVQLQGTGKMRLVHPPASGACSMIRVRVECQRKGLDWLELGLWLDM